MSISTNTLDLQHGCLGERTYHDQARKDSHMPSPSQTLTKAIQRQKYVIPTLEEENLHKLHGMKYMTASDRRQRSIPKHSPDVKIIPDDHHVYTMGSLQMD